ALRSLVTGHDQAGTAALSSETVSLLEHASFLELVDGLAASGHGVIMTMGKGGVGKTTIAAAVARELAARGHKVHLTTTDPAAHVASAVGEPVAGLTVGRIDPAEETRRYTEETLARAGAALDAGGLALLEEDLRSPCTEEIAVFNAFARAVAEGQDGFVILDTAPTGHTLLLLDASESYHREVSRNQSDVAPEVRELLPRLRDPGYTRVLIVTLPEPTPVHEAQRLQADLQRAGITPYAWVVNRSLARSETSDPLLRARAVGEGPYLREVINLAERATVLPWSPVEPSGEAGLRSLVHY
ncbi:MAG: ArsA-related P-loop ATPase, partial [Candidatus Sericytochromatia bacterium]